jgi:hypothetical protein
MKIEIQIPDQVFNEDPTYKLYFEVIQQMVNRMAVSHFKYGRCDSNAKTGSSETLFCGLQRMSMYDPRGIDQGIIWPPDAKKKPLDTGNTENLVDTANFVVIEAVYPKHPKAHFKAQTSKQSPGIFFKEEYEDTK